ncbi:hypothetical protein ACF0H5_024042 [Mactra antiquata]
MLWFTLLVLIMCGIRIGIAEDPACKTENTCDCCNSNPINGSTEQSDICNKTAGDIWKCTYGCKDGYWGYKCFHYCPTSCISCAVEYGTAGHQDRYKCYTCTNGCRAHFAGDRCNECVAEYYGTNCDKTCSNCLNGVCEQSTEICDNCVNEC